MTEKNPFGWEEKIEDGTLPPYQLALLVCGVLAGGFGITSRAPTAKDVAAALESAGEEVLKQVVDALPERMRMALHEHRVSQMMQALDDRDEAIVQAKGLKALLDDSRALINRMCSILDPTSTTRDGAEQIAARVAGDLAQAKLERDEAIKRAEEAEGEKDEAVARLDQHREATRIAHDHLAAARMSRDAAINRAEEAERWRDDARTKLKEADQALTVVARVRDLLEIASDDDTVWIVRNLVEERARALSAIEQTRGILKAHKGESLRSERDKLAGAEQDLNYARRRIAEMEATIKYDSEIWTSVRKVLSAADDESVLDGARRVVRERDDARTQLKLADHATTVVAMDKDQLQDEARRVLTSFSSESLLEAAKRVVGDRDALRNDYSKLKTDLHLILGKSPSETLLDAGRRVVLERNQAQDAIRTARALLLTSEPKGTER